ncbi:MAG: hypothetical protein BGO90_00415 [Legionella sp. 40-6]|nr:MAG: hypothetical protein BGO90_00415 [Legionella sp. 40-6]
MSLVEQFKNALSTEEALSEFLSALQGGSINPLDWDIKEITDLRNNYLKIFEITNYNFVDARIRFNESFAALLQKINKNNNDPEKTQLFQQVIVECMSYLTYIRSGLKNKRPSSNPEYPLAKKRRLDVNPQLQQLLKLGYNQSLAVEFLSNEHAPHHYAILIKWHEIFIHTVSPSDIMNIAKKGGEQSFVAFSIYQMALRQIGLTTADIIELIIEPYASERLSFLIHYIEVLISLGLNKQQLIVIGKSVYSTHNLPHMSQSLHQFSSDDIADLISKCPPEIFLLINQNLEYLTKSVLTLRHLINPLDTGEYFKICWMLSNFVQPLNPGLEFVWANDISQKIEKINQLCHMGFNYDILLNLSEIDYDLLISYTPQLQQYSFDHEEIVTFIRHSDYRGKTDQFLVDAEGLSVLGYQSEQIKQIAISSWGPTLSRALIQTTPALIERGYSTVELLEVLSDIFHSIVEKRASNLAIAKTLTPLLLSQGLEPVDLIIFFIQKLDHKSIIDSLLPILPPLVQFGFTSQRIIRIASNFDLNIYYQCFTRLKDLSYSSEQLLQVEKDQTLMLAVVKTSPLLLQQGYSIANIITIAAKCYCTALIAASEFTPTLIREGYNLSDLMTFFTIRINHRDVIQTLLEVTPKLLALGLMTKQIIGIAAFCKSEGLLLLDEHFQQIFENLKAREPNVAKEKLLSKIVSLLHDFNGLSFLKKLLQTINVPLDKPNRPLTHLLKKTKYYCPHLESYLFIYPSEIVEMRRSTSYINRLIDGLNFSGKTKVLKEHFALLMDEQLWSQLWPDLPPPEEILTPEDLQDKSLNQQNYHRTEIQDTAVYIDCQTTASALLCANHLKYLNQQVQKANEGIEEAIPQFQAVAMDNYVLIDNYGAYFDSLSSKYAERYENLPNNVDDFPVLAVDEAQRLGLITQDLGAKENPADALLSETYELNEFLEEEEPQMNMPSSPSSLGDFGFFSATQNNAERLLSENDTPSPGQSIRNK